MTLPALSQRMPADDQDRFNSYYFRWLQDRQTGDRDDMISMEQRMQDLMSRYSIPSDTPYDQVASQFGGYRQREYYRDDRGSVGQWQGRLSEDDQKEFNKEYGKWVNSRAKNDRDDIDKHARKMEEIMARYNIAPDTPFDVIATSTGDSRHYDYRQFQGRFSPDDQKKFDHEYREWQEERREGDREGVAKHEGKMQELMARYNIPRDVPYDVLASANRGY
jgi:hypothetical protein